MHGIIIRIGLFALTIGIAACQGYDFLYQPDATRRGVHLRFTVETPSKADILFVIDNSPSMKENQIALKNSIGMLLDELGPNDTSYRIGIISTDAIGRTTDCCGNDYGLGYATAIDRCDSDPNYPYLNCPNVDPAIKIRRPHDGALGRLIAAYDSASFNSSIYSLLLDTTVKQTAFEAMRPTSVTAGPVNGTTPTSVTGTQGVPWVIDRDIIRSNACNACSCDCSIDDYKDSDCYTDCVEDVAAAMVKAYFSSNIEGLGTNGIGWEQGIKTALLAIGVNPELIGDNALAPANSTLNGPNRFTDYINNTATPDTKWLRDQAILGVMFLTDEEDCSMQSGAFQSLITLEDSPDYPQSGIGPDGSSCYQTDGQALLIDTTRLGQLFAGRKGARIALGLIGGAQPTGPDEDEKKYISGRAADCTKDSQTASTYDPEYECSCLADNISTDQRWCDYTQDTTSPAINGGCIAMAGNRYVRTMTDSFSRLTFDSICQSDYSGALQAFAKKLISACFEIDLEVRPAHDSPSNIQVMRTPNAQEGSDAATTMVDQLLDCNEEGPGWCYVPPVIPTDPELISSTQKPQICLVGFDRLIGDIYDIFILSTDYYDATK
ncbi:MAG: VWA domain-containing protein [Deltaproteobacteria bacterium]|nr:VWA domain-containing protein [Deltaproteobacteria bacterium]